ncbi:hypothetical protein GOP47_0013801 [Adiantum capillus-veneris]|uniref:Uncharacterized protein n=1 Tax=Adiantum capillus-veneris TaxID=13818 RepID=A0A9D4UP78_ADICA|nr:hypothetical protein GOP47_0013801 [Adiantum capillus-veneris]
MKRRGESSSSHSQRDVDAHETKIMVLQYFGAYTSHPVLKKELLELENCHVRTMEMLRQANTNDCGYYIMLVMKLLIKAHIKMVLSCGRGDAKAGA